MTPFGFRSVYTSVTCLFPIPRYNVEAMYLSNTSIIQAILWNQDSDMREGYLKGDFGKNQLYGTQNSLVHTTLCLKHHASKFIEIQGLVTVTLANSMGKFRTIFNILLINASHLAYKWLSLFDFKIFFISFRTVLFR